MSRDQAQEVAPAPAGRAEIGATLSLAWPIVMTMIAVMVMETVDILMIGRLGEDALAAAALALNAWFLFLLFGMGVLNAVASLTSQSVAVGDTRGVRRSARQGLWIGLMMGLPFALILQHAEPVLVMLGQPAHIAAAAQSYLDYMGFALITVFLLIPIRLTMASYGVTRPAMVIVWLGVPLNALFNWIFMFGGLGGPELGLPGAGIATLLVDAFLVVIVAIYISVAPLFKELNLFVRFWRPDWRRFRKILGVGAPIGVASVMEHGLFASAALMMGWVGVTELAAHQVAVQMVSVLFMIPFGLGQAATIRIGLAAGARDLASVRLRGATIFGLAAAFMLCSAMAYWLFGDVLVGLFLSSDDPNRAEIVALGAGFLAIAALFQLFDGVQVAMGGALRGLNDTFVPMILALIGYWVVGLTGAYAMAFEFGFGANGIWLGMLAGLAFTALAVTLRFHLDTRTDARAFHRLMAAD
jgi:MATE family multidrug resistance protein